MGPLHQGKRHTRRSPFAIFAGLSLFVMVALVFSIFSSKYQTRTSPYEKLQVSQDENRYLKNKRAPAGDQYLLGVGRADITGPAVEINFAGYADLDQSGTGIRQRLYARAFIVGDVENTSDRFVYLILDTQSGDTAVRNGILEGLAALGDDFTVYGKNNVAVTGTHSHSGPGAWFNYLLPQITSLGWSEQSYQAIVDGAVLSIQRAHESLTTGTLDVGTTTVDDANINRSLYAYMNNPEEERTKYSDSTDKTLTLMRFTRDSDGLAVGVLTWYAVHPTSMLGNNTHVSGDNKGVASYLFEKEMASSDLAASDFVAGFSQANVGDTSPNVLGAYCDDGSGEMCDYETSTCLDGTSQYCHGRGPLFYNLDLGVTSCYEIGKRQYSGAKSIFESLDSSGTPIVGSTVKSFHVFQDMQYFEFPLENGTMVQTCPAALGYSFAAGTSDWPGAFDFTQADSGDPDANPIWAVVSGLLKTPSDEQAACQEPKPILLDVGEMDEPYAWTPNIVDIQLLRVGQFVIIVSPSEATTMSGRRWREAVADAASDFLDEEPIVVLGGPANSYAHYVATTEEYAAQRYEGASTLFGQYELNGYINVSLSNLDYLRPDAAGSPDPGPTPPDNRGDMLSFITGVVQDNAPLGYDFGDCTGQPDPAYFVGDVINATFVGANPRNNLRLEGTFAVVEKLDEDTEEWTQVRDDYDWFLVYTWERTNWLLGYSEVTISWETEDYAEEGTYRIRYYGDSKALLTGSITAFEGASDEFTLS
ncbi:putative neutral ceramidase protein [Zalerion maritima]|uniref:Neutral ceramidase n=1 Tax=Zalerion maritima TaxID=339359 RepID=A0AAD5RT99_9PEZI|nr:putative neutral ceramidase protein [Zalerion maritima]